MRPVPPTRSRRTSPLQTNTIDVPAAVQAQHVSIPLKAQQPPTSMPPRLTQAIKDEFAIRYLQQIGANSTPENIAMVLQHLPLEKCAVSSAWKSRGSLADVLQIDWNPKSLSLGALLSPRRQLRGQHSFQIGTVCFTFDDMKRKFLLPFKLATVPTELDVLQVFGNRLEADKTLSPNQAHRRLKAVDERNVPPNASAETVSEMHNEFYLTLPLISLGLPEGNEITRTVLYEALSSTVMIELVQSTLRYLYFKVIDPTRKKIRISNEQDALFVAIAQQFALLRVKMEHKQRLIPRSLTVLVPLLLLALRVDIETLVRLQYPLSFSCASEEMTRLLQDIDAQITRLLDPDGNWSRLAVLETTHEAGQARASSTFQRARRYRRLRDQFFQTSAVLHGLFPDPSSGNSRRVMTQRGGAGISHYTHFFSRAAPTAKQEECRLSDVSVASKLSLLQSLRRSQQS
ncbi:uncharacterized protein PITG_00517 [Phytophthora infestans T30-4]|uniref:Uncharacterized protein n=1 Tax=Phytophthora infestans (strain T30-4) TaxID=403677 RepID=D0MR06_PHYIT|nr:uncharacterized protein PITG_00517 [Phytophthora infestans T30-4]EEY57925.1 conserved hypothetical protein [Phytophthora infestans T30-4]|eukprot:XP_002909111.1 conserved hypothetical protein [Phytophthora infestans T30-4]